MVLKAIRKMFSEGVLKNPKVKEVVWREQFVPRKGMLIKSRETKRQLITNPVTGQWEEVMVVPEIIMLIDVVGDDEGNLKFQFMGPTQMGWTAWMDVDYFNNFYEVQNPWIVDE